VPVDVIVPTYQNEYWLKRCLRAFAEAKMPELGKVIIVDNGGDYYASNHFTVGLDTMVLSPGKNLGWTGGLAEGLKHSTAEYVMFMNDDAEFERMPDRLALMLEHFADPSVAAVGPATGTAMGRQAVEGPDIEETKVLVGFCVLLKRSDLEVVGGVLLDWDLGDDIDLCIRLTRAGKKMVIDRRVFVYHHAFKTGVKVYGQPKKVGGWNSIEMVSATTQRLILKHGAQAVLEALGEEASPQGVRSMTIEA
jgi:GT2 family glycosyltransferase